MKEYLLGLGRRAVALCLILVLCIGSVWQLAYADTATSSEPVATTSALAATSSDLALPTATTSDELTLDTAVATSDPALDAATTTPGLNATSTEAAATSTEGTGGQSGASIDTGDAIASTSVAGGLNTNEANDIDQPGETNSSTITASTTNEATSTTLDQTEASTGNNTATSSDLSTIVTGVAQATANIINEVNTNIFNSAGLILFLNQLFGGGFDLNFYDLSFFFAGGPGASPTQTVGTTTPQCTLLTCLNSSALNVLNTNDATITNSVIVRSSTGGNAASSSGDATISTGDAYAAANVVNLVNTNIVNSSYLLLSFNNFGDLTENITLPGQHFFSNLFDRGEASSSINSSSIAIEGTSTVALTGTTTASAETGDNIATSTEASSTAEASSTPTGSGAIDTGVAYSSATTFNQANTTRVGGTSVFMLFRVSGPWSGHIVGLPEGLVAKTIPDGSSNLIEIQSQDATTTPEAAQLLQEFNSSQFTSMATNTAAIENNVEANADTGHNQATSSAGLSSIMTGSAYAAANVVNLVNTNIVGQNWIFAVFNIFGGLSGDIVFSDGAPNLTLRAEATPADTAPGGSVTYTFTVANTGDADATDVILNATFDNTLLAFDAASGASSTLTGASWHLGLIPRGGTRTFTAVAKVGSNFPAGQQATVPLTAAAVNNVITSPATSNNVHADIVVTSPAAPSTGGGGGGSGGSGSAGGGPIGLFGAGGGVGFPSTASPSIHIEQSSSSSTIVVPATIDFKVSVSDPDSAGPLYGATLEDTLYAPDGSALYDKSWALDTVNPGDLINLSYSVAFAASTTPGTYRYVTKVSGMANHPFAGSATTTQSDSVLVIGAPGEVLGEATSTPSVPVAGDCALKLTSYLARGRHNPINEVIKLQAFLDLEGEALPITGFFGPMTSAAVSRFQTQFADEVLTPLGLTEPTGGVYALTEHKINELACDQ